MKIFIPEPIPSGNKGEEAILQGIAQGFINQGIDPDLSVFSYTVDLENDRRNYAGQFTVISGRQSFRPRPRSGRTRKLLETVSICLKHFSFALLYRLIGEKACFIFSKEYWRAYADAALIMVGHDGFISDLNLLLATFVKVIGKRSVIFGGGVKSFKLKITEVLAKYILTFVDIIVVREKHCYRYFRSLGVPARKLFFRPDPAFIMEPSAREEIDAMFVKEDLIDMRRPLIGMIALVETSYYRYFYGGSQDKEKKFKQHMDFFARMAENIIDITSGTIVFVPHAVKTGFAKDDRMCAREIRKKMTRHYQHVVLMENEYSARQLKGFIQRIDFLVSQRLHAVISASTVATPFIMVAVKEDYRSHDIIEHTVKTPELLFDLNNPTIDDFTKKFGLLWQRRKKIEKMLKQNAEGIKRDCNQAFEMMLERLGK
ncbi:hypothetical protein C6A36_00020 [Desulfobacteraceae bacterium SEEP-SAG10]|nr:hypothetical protein C6A36_00020 [Desulfobacteraceae bacterium SEEP-SAG10]